MVEWSKSFLAGCEYSIRIDDHISSSWSSEWGAGQSRRFSPPFFNIGSLSMPLWIDIAENIIFPDDSSGVIHGDTKKEVNQKIKLAVESRT